MLNGKLYTGLYMGKIKRVFMSEWAVIFLMLAGILTRGIMLGSIPGGINQDEALAGYEAYSLLHFGTDSFGYAFPVYFNAWGSGMNALNSYLMIPFIAVFGLHTWVIRIPQFLVSCFSMYVFYKLLLKLFNRKTALIGLLYFAICPWSIIMARWGLESNLAPGFLLFGLYFFILGAEKSKYYIFSALFYGLSLYCYATIWPIVPIVLILQALYLIWTKRFRIDRYAVLSVVLLVLIALPLIIFYLINTGRMDEISTAFFSIPRLTVMRESDISIWDKRSNMTTLITVLLNQYDDQYWNAAPQYGLYYKWALPFAVIGLFYCILRALKSTFTRVYNPCVLLLVQFFCAVFLGCLIEININRINCIHIPVITFIVIGMCQILGLSEKLFRHIWKLAAAALLVCFVFFAGFYFKEYRENIGIIFQEGIGESLEHATDLAGTAGDIHVDSYINYSKILFYSKLPVTTYRDTVVYTNFPNAYLSVSTCGNYIFEIPDTSADCIYVITESHIKEFEDAGWDIEQYGHCAVAYKRLGNQT